MIALAWLMVAAGAVTQAATGFGFSLVSAPFLVAAYHAPEGVQLNLILSTVVNIGLLLRAHRGANVKSATALLVPAALATVAVGLLVRSADTRPLTIVAGTVCLVATVALATGMTLRRLHTTTATAAVGAVSGAMNVTAGIGGPPIALFAMNAGWPLRTARPTMQLYFLGINAVALVTLGLPDELPLGAFAALAAGIVAGRAVADRVPARATRRLTLVLAAAGAVLAIGRGL